MDSFDFETCLRREAQRNCWENVVPARASGFELSSTAHEGFLCAYALNDRRDDARICLVSPEGEQIVHESDLGNALQALLKPTANGYAPLRTERQAIVRQRVAQQRYRAALAELWGNRCALTGLDIPELLRASHAKPWKDANDAERVDPYNGFLFEARIDLLFDRGLITFNDAGALILSPCLSQRAIAILRLAPNQRLRHIYPQHLPYLHWHQTHIFRQFPIPNS